MPSNTPQIVLVKSLLSENLDIPNYQRPYRWSTESTLVLFNDLYSAFKNNIPEYRIGSIVLYHDNNGKDEKYYIVDGQQRVTTLSILFYCLTKVTKNSDYESYSKLLTQAEAYNELSSKAIIENQQILEAKCKQLNEDEITKFVDYILGNCTFVRICTDKEQEAFQFFDSQNSRGKSLSPHDLLKSYHLREMNEDSEDSKIKIINDWENTDQDELAKLFESTLYPLVRWYKNQDGLYYSSKKIKTFKGIKQDNNYNFSIYHKAANLYIEHFNSDGMYELTSGEKIRQFQLTQPLVSGRRFFLYTLHYYKLYNKVKSLIYSKFSPEELLMYGTGNSYVRKLFINVVIFFVDKFNFETLRDVYLNFFYKWAYSLRTVMHAVYKETVNKYALGTVDRVNNGLNIFQRISEMQNPEEIETIILQKVERSKLDTYKSTGYLEIWKKLFEEKTND